MIVVTNNRCDFEKIYQSKKVHPGIVFLACEDHSLFTKAVQLVMMVEALSEVQKNEPNQEAILVEFICDHGDELEMSLSRYALPGHAFA